MHKLIQIINFILIRTINYAIFSEFTVDYLNEKNNNFVKHTIYYCGYHKNYNNTDWRFSVNSKRKNIKYIKLILKHFI